MAQIHFSLVLLAAVYPIFALACSRSRSFGEPCGNYQQNAPGNYQGAGGNGRYPYGQQNYGGYGQTAVVSSQDECDSKRFLRCDRNTGTCQCPDIYSYFWDSYQARCYIKVGYACTETFGGLSESYYSHGCPENSYCNPGRGICDCRPLFKRNFDYTGCSLSAAFRNPRFSQQCIGFVVPILVALGLARWILI